ncbi:HpcH/HpaI aldolase/citrate lyase family protein [Mycobacterium intracellulare]|uniref:HpcH/HpaI aldolase/citrate lyase family protein n=1 Tax=Mycobacterium intracellulare TaxID=1767 RepID=UPI001F608E47|nr:CoA ester lyase [Mycobacterium intracellulare]
MSNYSSAEIASARTLLFVPASRPERFAKAAAVGSDVVVIDLEDAVGPDDKVAARDQAAAWISAGNPAMVRINGCRTPWYEDDVAMVTALGAPTMLPKTEDIATVTRLTHACGLRVVALVETATGVLNAPAVAGVRGVDRLAFGSIDFAAELGVDPLDREALAAARSALVIASAAAGLAGPVDGVTTALRDTDVLREDVRHGCRLGFTGKLCIHPAQVAVAHDSLAPTPDDVSWARLVVAGTSPDGSAISVDGRMVDAPVVARARRILSDDQRAGASAPTHETA